MKSARADQWSTRGRLFAMTIIPLATYELVVVAECSLPLAT